MTPFCQQLLFPLKVSIKIKLMRLADDNAETVSWLATMSVWIRENKASTNIFKTSVVEQSCGFF